MATKAGFRRNAKTVAKILRDDPNLKAAVRAAAERVLAEINDPDARIEEYETDRYVAAVVVPADRQARDGIATRAAGTVGLSPG